MRPNYHDIMQSGTVGFIIGKSRKRFWIHNALTSHFPKKILNSPVNDEIDEIDFGRCCEFVYTGDYSVPLPVADQCGDEPSDSQALSRESARRWNPLNHRVNMFHPTQLPHVCAFIEEELDKTPLDEDGKVPNTDPADNYAGVFLAHAKVYHLAHTTDWHSLCALSLYRLIRSLASLTLCEEQTGDIVKLLKFVFEEIEDINDMQDVLVHYAAWNVEILMRDADFRQLLDRVPSLETAIFRLIWSEDVTLYRFCFASSG
ncbi:hypothetical protein KXW39_002482 [Aspergillus fumigatus]|nr:hypothetical protein KXW38_003074 [Aspergillus fumigatus]KAH2913006.1 hypothetical protein KXW25_001381 [Aspergillus fumigatus]KAH3294763.1 hypothetical protein KXV87_006688 [Aspergillus fumigatus]KAH3434738.1 hypothetical protein KXW39_002482 [Aspergillus fumigatus]KAH3525634.1 hypothetical protein KXV64_004491 [Aspergillus fumigatus]